MDSDSQGDSFRKLRNNIKDEKVHEQTYGKRFVWPSFRLGSIPLPSRLFRTFRISYGNFQSFLRWYTFSFLPIVWIVLFILYNIIV